MLTSLEQGEGGRTYDVIPDRKSEQQLCNDMRACLMTPLSMAEARLDPPNWAPLLASPFGSV